MGQVVLDYSYKCQPNETENDKKCAQIAYGSELIVAKPQQPLLVQTTDLFFASKEDAGEGWVSRITERTTYHAFV